MNDINAVLAGRIEDKWIEFAAEEFVARRNDAQRRARLIGQRTTHRVRQVEVHASYVWLLAGAVLAWFIG